MANYNKVILMGNLTRDPELRYTPKGTPVASFGLAVNRTWKDENGQQVSDALFVDVAAFGVQADLISRYFKKGRPIFMEGRLKLDSWEDKQTGQRRNKLSVVLESFQFLDSSRQEGGHSEAGAYGAPQGQPYAPQARGQQQPYGGNASAPYYGGGQQAPQGNAFSQPSVPPSAVPPAADASQEDDVPF